MDEIERMRIGGWRFNYSEATMFVEARHPNGGRMSVVEIKRVEFTETGHDIAAMFNGEAPKSKRQA